MTLRVTNFGAACVVIEADGTRILCDPWFSAEAYLGAWQRQDYIPDPVTTIGPCDYVWISHLHCDHYDPAFLRYYLAAYPKAKLWISTHCRHLTRMTAEFQPLIANSIAHDGWIATIIPNHGYPDEAGCNIDTALVVANATAAVVNLNDNPFCEKQVARINGLTAGKHVTALLPFTGAGPWPQCYHMTHIEKYTAAREKRERFLKQFVRYKHALHANVAVPFSAGYVLRGPLAELNKYRGIPDVCDVPEATLLPIVGAVPRRAETFTGFAWEDDLPPSNAAIVDLIEHATASAPKVDGAPLSIRLDWGHGTVVINCTTEPAPEVHETIIVHPKLLVRLLDGRAHFNDFEISSHPKIIRHGAAYDARVFCYLLRFQTRVPQQPSPLQDEMSCK